MRRGEVWTVSGSGYAGKPHPAVIIQDDRFGTTASVTICMFTKDGTDAPLFRISVNPGEGNGLRIASRLMADKITTVSKNRMVEREDKGAGRGSRHGTRRYPPGSVTSSRALDGSGSIFWRRR